MHAWAALLPWRWTKDKRAPDRLMQWLRSLVDGGVLTKDQIRKILDYLIVKLVSRLHAITAEQHFLRVFGLLACYAVGKGCTAKRMAACNAC